MWGHARLAAKTINNKFREYKDDEKVKERVMEEIEMMYAGEHSDGKLKKAKDKVTRLIQYEAYGEANPQTILQATILWKRPLACFELNNYNTGMYIFCTIP